MNSRFLARRSAEDFASSVDALQRGQTADERADAHLLELVGALRSAEAPAPRPDFSQDLRARLMTEAEATLSPQSARLSLPPRTRGVRERRFVAAASVAVLLGGSATMAAASQDALPGEALYPIKRGLEQARSSLTFSEDSRGERLLDRATGRLAEASRLATDGGAIGLEERLRSTLGDFSSHADEGTALLFASYAETGDVADVETVRAFLTTSLGSLDALTGQLPAELHGELSELAVMLRDLDAEAMTLCGQCGPADVLELPATFLAFGEVKDALEATGKATEEELSNAHPLRPEVVVDMPTLPQAPAQPEPGTQQPGTQQPGTQQPPAQGEQTPPAAPGPDVPATEDLPKGLISTVVDILRQGGQTAGAKPTKPQGEDTPGRTDEAPDAEPTPTEKPLQGVGEGLGGLLNSLLGGK